VYSSPYRALPWAAVCVIAGAGMPAALGAQEPEQNRLAQVASASRQVLKQQAREARDRQQPARAEQLYRELLALSPTNDVRAGLAMALAEQGRWSEGLAVLATSTPDSRETARAHVYVLQLGPDPVRALEANRAALARFPDDTELQRQRLDLLLRLGAPFLAHEIAQNQGEVGAGWLHRINMDRAALLLRWSRQGLSPLHGEDPQTGLDQALAWHESALAQAAETPAQADDRLQLLVQRGLLAQAMALGQQRPDAQWSAFARAALADTYLSQRQPRRAVDLYRSAIAEYPRDLVSIPWRHGLVYALLETGDHTACREALESLVADVPPFVTGVDGQRQANPEHVHVTVLHAMVNAYLEDTRQARRSLDAIRALAPFSATVRQAEGNLALMRGWPRQARSHYERLQVDEPQADGPLTGLADAALALGEYPLAQNHLDSLRDSGRSPIREAQLRQQLQDAQRPIFSGHFSGGQESALGLKTSRDGDSSTRLTSAAFGQWRVFAQHQRQSARDPRSLQVARHNTVGLGLQWRGAPGWGEMGLNASTLSGGQTGLFASVAWTPDDHWSLQARLDSDSSSTPLKARQGGIRGQQVALDLGHRVDEHTRFNLSADQLRLSDGNQRLGLSTSWSQGWVRSPRFQLDTTLGASAGQNRNLPDAPYFNPARDSSLWLNARQQWTLHQHYEQAALLRLELSAGRYRQQGFGSGPTWAVALEGEWRQHHGRSITLGVARSQRPYDGVPHRYSRVFMRWEWRL